MHTPHENRKYGLIESAHIKPIQSLTELPDRNTFFGIGSRSPRSGFVVRKLGCRHLGVGIRDKEIFCGSTRQKSYSVENHVGAECRSGQIAPTTRRVQMEGRRRVLTPSLLFVVLALLVSSVLRADVTGSIQGVVRDRTQAAISGATLTVVNAQTNFRQQTISGADGSYRFLALPPGTYQVTASSAGFREFTATDVIVKVNDQLQVDITLQVGSVNEKVSIVANAVQVQTESTQLGDVIDSKKMLALPLNGRSFVDLLGLQAGVAPVTAETIQQDRPVSGILNSGNISVNGQRETSNAYLVNGGDVSEGRNLGAGLVPNLDSIAEFRLITNSFDAEYGKFSGAVVNAITKSGTNGFHGDVFEFLRNDILDARNYFVPSKSELRRNQFGFAVGGPVWKNHIFWFSDYQGTRQIEGAETGLVTVPTADARLGNFDPTTLTGTVDGAYWAQVLNTRL